ncbi:MAG: argininosuccinate lyase [Candidatus Melainabacteria bacterium]|nr:MAG: argininosuccinate lyase [Candidatus Melainabacteria bacterium]
MQVLRKAFKQPLSDVVTEFVACTHADAHLVKADLTGSKAHAQMLAEEGLISPSQGEAIQGGLDTLLAKADEGKFELKVEYEDVHMNVEKQLEELIGSDALRLHTARSRNDQVALDLRLYTVGAIDSLVDGLKFLQASILKSAKKHADVVMPGYTHLQRAQPVLYAHAILAFHEMFSRDIERFTDCKKRTAVSPLGAGAQAGSGLSINPQSVAAKLGFEKVFTNSIDAVSDRDFAAEFLMACSLTAVHISQMAETLVIWSSSEFGFVELADNVTTTSSLMPHKKNPDPLEIARAKSGAVIGDLVNLLVTLKALPLGYNRDLQETKPPVINSAGIVGEALKVMACCVDAVTVNVEKTLAAASDPALMTTDLVEYLVNRGVPFRKAHETIAEIVADASEKGVALPKMELSEYKKYADEFENDLYALFDPKLSVSAKKSHGSTGTELVRKQI